MKVRTVLILTITLACAAVLRIGYLQERVREPDYRSPLLDSAYHHYWASALATGDWTVPEGFDDPQIRTTPFFRPPGYPYFLAGMYRMFDVHPLVAFVVQALLGLVNIVLAFLFSRRWIGDNAALWFAGFMGVSWIFIYFEAELLAPAILLPLTLLSLWFLSRIISCGSPGRSLAAAVPMGLLTLALPNLLLFIPCATIWIFSLDLRRASWRSGLLNSAIFLSVCAMFIAPVTLRNIRTDGSMVLISANGGINLYLGNNEQSNGIDPAAPDVWGWSCFEYPAIVRKLEYASGQKLNYAQASSLFTRKALDYVRSHPSHAFQLAFKKVLLFWGPVEIGNEKEIEAVRMYSPLLRRLPFPFSWMLALGVVGMARYLWELKSLSAQNAYPRRKFLGLNLLFIFILFVSYLPFFAADRYRVPILPLLLMFAALAVERIARWLLQGQWKVAAPWLASGCILWALTSRNLGGYEPRPYRWHIERGISLASQNRLEEATREFETAIRLHPGEVMAHFNLAEVSLLQGRRADAIRHYSDALRFNPDFLEAHINQGKAYAQLGDIRSAVTCFQKAVALDPTNIDAQLSLGFSLLETSRPDLARPHFQNVLKLDPGHPAAMEGLSISSPKEIKTPR